MHHQVLLSKEVVPMIKEVAVNNDVSRCVAFYEDNVVTYDVFPDHIKVVRDVDGEFEDIFEDNQFYDKYQISAVTAYILRHHHKRKLKRGVTLDTVMIYNNEGDSRFEVTIENTVPTFHDKEGLVFQCLEGNCYAAVPIEVVCDLLISRMGQTIKLFDPTYLVRLKLGNGYVYAPLTAAFQDPVIRDLENFKICRAVTGTQWADLLRDLRNKVEDYTKPNK